MYSVIRSGELQPSPGGTVTFEGEPYESGVSFFLVNDQPGAGRLSSRRRESARADSRRDDP